MTGSLRDVAEGPSSDIDRPPKVDCVVPWQSLPEPHWPSSRLGDGFHSWQPIHSRRWLKTAFDQLEVLWIVSFEDFSSSAHVCTGELVGCPFLIIELEIDLPKAQVNPRVTDRSRAPHRILQRTSCGLVVARSDCVLSEGNEKPARSVPPALRLRQQSDRFHKELVGLAEFSFRHSLRACLCHRLHVAED